MLDWTDPSPAPAAAHLAAALAIHPLVAGILMRRGFADPISARAFLDPDFYRPQPPEALPGVSQALLLIRRALAKGDPILIWGDFDVDGQTATALLVQALSDLGGRVSAHIPVRAQEGHGISLPVLAGLLDAADPPRLLITCDTGATAFEAVELARARGVTVIVTDHHELSRGSEGERLSPPADAFVTPRLLPGADDFGGEAALRHHPLAALPGVGVAYKLIEGLYDADGRREDAEDYLDLVALGIVGDVALLAGDTRYLLQRGLQRLRQTPRPGLQAIYERSNLDPRNLNEEHVGFVIAPRMNALGRLGDANPAVELLTTADGGRARLLALQLEGLNARRQLLTSQTLQSALKQIQADPTLLDYEVLLLAHPAWEPGVIGIVAGRLAERFSKPVALAACPPGSPARGSARSVSGVDITAALAAQANLLHSYGGHALAAGFTLDADNLQALRRGLSRAAGGQAGGVAAAPLEIDAYLDWSEISLALAEEVERLAPFGPGNRPPVFASRGLLLAGQSVIGREQEHLSLGLEDAEGLSRRLLWWGGVDFALGDQRSGAIPPGPMDVAYVLRATTYRGGRDVQLEWLDYRLTPEAVAELARRIQVDDFRHQSPALAVLQRWLETIPQEAGGAETEVLIWAEGEARAKLAERLPGRRVVGRDELEPCGVLVVWTAPASAAELSAALKRCRPLRVGLFAVLPAADRPQPFLERLAGLARHTIEHSDGRALAVRLAAAMAQSEAAVRKGLEWMAQRGLLKVEMQDGMVELAAGELADAQPQAAAARLEQLAQLLEESRAFRTYYARSESLDLSQFL